MKHIIKHMLYFLLIIFCSAHIALIAMEDEPDDIDYSDMPPLSGEEDEGFSDFPPLSGKEEYNQRIKELEKKTRLTELQNLIYNLKNLDQTLYAIKDILLSDLNKITNDELKKINNSYSQYKQKSQDCLKNCNNSNDNVFALLQEGIALLHMTTEMALKKNITISSNLINNANKMRTDFFDKYGSLIEDAPDEDNFDMALPQYGDNFDIALPKNDFSKKTNLNSRKIPSFEKIQFEHVVQDYKEKHINEHEKFFISSWTDFCNWKEDHRNSEHSEEKLINSYIESKISLIKQKKEDQCDALVEKLKWSIDFSLFEKIANNLLSHHEDILGSLKQKEQGIVIDQLLKTAHLAFFNVGYTENQDFIVQQPLDCLILLGDFFHNNIDSDNDTQWYGYINEHSAKKNVPCPTIKNHIEKYTQLKNIIFPNQNIDLPTVAMLHALTRISFQGISDKDLSDINALFLCPHSKEKTIEHLTSVYHFALFFNRQAFNKSELIKNTHNKKNKNCFLNWHQSFTQNIGLGKSILFVKKDLLFNDTLIKNIFDKYIKENKQSNTHSSSNPSSQYQGLGMEPASVEEEKKEEEEKERQKINAKINQDNSLIINYLLLAYARHQKICNHRSIRPKQFWQEADELWQSKINGDSDLFSSYTTLMTKWLAWPSLFTKNTRLPEFAKKYQEACIALYKLEGAKNMHNEALDLVFINWWKPLYTPAEGQTFVDYTAIKKGLMKKAKELNNYQWRLGHECRLVYLMRGYFGLGKAIVKDLMHYEQGFKLLGGTEQNNQQTANNYVFYAARSLYDPTSKGLSGYFKEQIFR